MNTRNGSKRLLPVVASAALSLALVLVAPSVAWAGLTLTAPASGAVVDLDARNGWRIGFSASCPAGKTCGAVNSPGNALVPGSVFFELRGATNPGGEADGRFQGGMWHWASASAAVGDTTATVAGFETNASGRWTISTTWMECPLSAYPYETAGDPCIRQLVERPVTIRPTITTPWVALYGARGNPRLAGTTISFYRTAPLADYRARVVLQKQVRRGRWATVATSAGQRFSKSTSVSGNRHANAFPRLRLPAMPDSTKLRARITVTTVGAKPAMKARTLTTSVKTRGELKKDSTGGGIVIGGR